MSFGLGPAEAVILILFFKNTSQSKLFSSASFIIKEILYQQRKYYINIYKILYQQLKYYTSTTKMFGVLVDPVDKFIKTRAK